MFGSSKSAESIKRNNGDNENQLPLLGSQSDKKNDDHDQSSDRLYVKIKSGDSPEVEIDIDESDTVADLKIKLSNKMKIVGKRIRLIASGRLLDPSTKTLIGGFKIQSGAFIHAVITENVLASANVPNGTLSGEENVPGPTTYRGLDQLNAGTSLIKNQYVTHFQSSTSLIFKLVRHSNRNLMRYRERV